MPVNTQRIATLDERTNELRIRAADIVDSHIPTDDRRLRNWRDGGEVDATKCTRP